MPVTKEIWKTSIFGHFWPKSGRNIFFSKIGLCHFFLLIIPYYNPKNQENLMRSFWEKGWLTTNYQLLWIHRTCPLRRGSKKKTRWKSNTSETSSTKDIAHNWWWSGLGITHFANFWPFVRLFSQIYVTQMHVNMNWKILLF